MDKLDMILEKLDGMDSEIKELRTDMTEVKGEVKKLNEDMAEVKGEVKKLNEDMAEVKGRVKNIEFALENEIRPNIMRIAEGHVDLSRKLQMVVKTNNEFELLTVRVNVLESSVETIKKKLSRRRYVL